MYKTNFGGHTMGSDIKFQFHLIKEWLKEYLFIFYSRLNFVQIL